MIIGIGIDAVEIDRVERMYAELGDRMLNRLFTGDELSYIRDKAAPAQHLAVRLAAKEAAYKALAGNELARGIGWRDVEVVSRDDGAPMLRLHGRAKQRYAELGGHSIHVSLTHSITTAVAVVIVER
ncbi:MAG TPA: holo-ACP synthase [Gemmatimonadaceae bacterium]|jgi:holo-[acyl-carrier protein] synthase|nr:holo-ACP synthase [Gemmatimonadaceae bacterium]